MMGPAAMPWGFFSGIRLLEDACQLAACAGRPISSLHGSRQDGSDRQAARVLGRYQRSTNPAPPASADAQPVMS